MNQKSSLREVLKSVSRMLTGNTAELGLPLGEVAAIARRAADQLCSMGVPLGACTVPSVGEPGFELGADEIEFGLGIHGEKGVERTGMQSADAKASLLETIVADLGLRIGVRLALLVNGLGGTPPMELDVVARAALATLRSRGFAVERAWSGTVMTAIETPGWPTTGLLDWKLS